MKPTIFRIYYMRPEFLREGLCGTKTDDLQRTHVYLKDFVMKGGSGLALDVVFHEMQAEHWSPHGEARGLIEQKGLAHTSMSVGDVAVLDGDPWVVASVGFEPLPKSVLRNVPDERGAVA